MVLFGMMVPLGTVMMWSILRESVVVMTVKGVDVRPGIGVIDGSRSVVERSGNGGSGDSVSMSHASS